MSTALRCFHLPVSICFASDTLLLAPPLHSGSLWLSIQVAGQPVGIVLRGQWRQQPACLARQPPSSLVARVGHSSVSLLQLHCSSAPHKPACPSPAHGRHPHPAPRPQVRVVLRQYRAYLLCGPQQAAGGGVCCAVRCAAGSSGGAGGGSAYVGSLPGRRQDAAGAAGAGRGGAGLGGPALWVCGPASGDGPVQPLESMSNPSSGPGCSRVTLCAMGSPGSGSVQWHRLALAAGWWENSKRPECPRMPECCLA